MAAVPTQRNFIDDLGRGVQTFFTDTLPMVQQTIQGARETYTTMAGKTKTPTPLGGATQQELVPRDMGNLSEIGAGISTTMLLVGLVAVGLIFIARKR